MRVFILTQGGWATPLVEAILKSRHELVGTAIQATSTKAVLRRWPLIKKIFGRYRKDKLYRMLRSNKIPSYLINSANKKTFAENLKKSKPDIILVACWSEVIKKQIWSIPKYRAVNFHPSLLPQERGANPFASAILNGKGYTGITFHSINEEVDAGDILYSERVDIFDSETGGELAERCAHIAALKLPAIFDSIESGDISPRKQDTAKATYCRDMKGYTGLVDIDKPAKEIHDYVRAVQPWVAPFFKYGRKRVFIKKVKLIKSRIEDGYPTGGVIKTAPGGIYVNCKDATILLEKSQDG